MRGDLASVLAGIAAGIVLIIAFLAYSNNETAVSTHPIKVSIVVIPKGASVPDSGLNFDPKTAIVIIGINNTVQWENLDNVPGTVISDTNYIDPVSGNFSSLAQTQQVKGGSLLPGGSFNFTFTKPGKYGYHSEPHPWMSGIVIVSAS